MTMDDNSPKVALVTGAARGIGRAIALELARRGVDVVLNCQSRVDAAEQVADQVRDFGRRALVVQADVAREEQVASMVAQAVKTFGCIDILVNNAAIHRGGRVQTIAPRDWALVIDVALKGTFNCCRHIVPLMVAKQWGRIVCISSNAGVQGSAGDTAYGSAKAGLIGFSKSLAKEVARHGITTNVVVPGFLQTDMTAPLFHTATRLERELQRIPMGRAGEPEEIAEMVGFLALGASYVTGAVIPVDGGMGM